MGQQQWLFLFEIISKAKDIFIFVFKVVNLIQHVYTIHIKNEFEFVNE